MIVRFGAEALPVNGLHMGFGQVDLKEGIERNIKIIANYHELVQAGLAYPILPIADGRLTLLDQRRNLRLSSGGLLSEVSEIFS